MSKALESGDKAAAARIKALDKQLNEFKKEQGVRPGVRPPALVPVSRAVTSVEGHISHSQAAWHRKRILFMRTIHVRNRLSKSRARNMSSAWSLPRAGAPGCFCNVSAGEQQQSLPNVSRSRADPLPCGTRPTQKLTATWENEREEMKKLQAIKAEIDRVNLEVQNAEREYDLNRAAELKYGVLVTLQKQLKQAEEALTEQARDCARTEPCSAVRGVPAGAYPQVLTPTSFHRCWPNTVLEWS